MLSWDDCWQWARRGESGARARAGRIGCRQGHVKSVTSVGVCVCVVHGRVRAPVHRVSVCRARLLVSRTGCLWAICWRPAVSCALERVAAASEADGSWARGSKSVGVCPVADPGYKSTR